MADSTVLEKAAAYIEALEERNAYLEELVNASEGEKLAQAKAELRDYIKTAGVDPEDVDDVLDTVVQDEKLASLMRNIAEAAPRQPAPLGVTFRDKTAAAGNPRAKNRANLINFIMS